MSGHTVKKKVILIIIDSFHPVALQNCLNRGMVPAMAYLIENGCYNPECVSVFPTVTPTASSSIITGLPPSRHQVAGFVWFDRREKRIVNYGSSAAAIIKKLGVSETVYDLLYNLNHRHLSGDVKTVYEALEEAGCSTAAINFYIFRGNSERRAGIPFLMRLYSRFRLSSVQLRVPRGFYLGRLCQPESPGGKLAALPGYFGRWGINDSYSGRVAAWLVREGRQPHLMTVYFPDTDYYCHSHNPAGSEESLVRADRQLGRILDAFPSRQRALEDNIFIMAGDHSQGLVLNERGAMIDLPYLLRDYSQVQLGESPARDRDLAIGPNGRMAQVYLLRQSGALKEKVIAFFLDEPGVDQVIWKEGDVCHVAAAGGELTFRGGGEYRDASGGNWSLAGDAWVLNLGLTGKKISYGEYPDALHRIASFMGCANAGDIVATAGPGFEFTGEGAPGHPGAGSHGSLHREDSTVPLIISGAGDLSPLRRITDIVPFIEGHFGLAPRN